MRFIPLETEPRIIRKVLRSSICEKERGVAICGHLKTMRPEKKIEEKSPMGERSP